ncbi:MAG: metal-dependent hydrolase [Drouetiella hepatica Uher 2000/2452]|jgi:inner membrane protein|uniref:Metal-dependent hydrolase n=1 Tax=Drouetiella hepatica Uher 2000/2452 TaxID=904376 RepID=A0A951QE57_9CYAN|nr:metal-dependent hydrolase [Drouetiella hepatica Uher 2000/2452]
MIARIYSLPLAALDITCILIGSLLPDIDVDGAVITRPGTILGRFIPYGLAKVLDGIASTLAQLLNAVFGHRGFTHAPSLWLGLILWGAIAGKPYIFWLGFSALFHVVGDALTISGIPLLSPVSKKGMGLSFSELAQLLSSF